MVQQVLVPDPAGRPASPLVLVTWANDGTRRVDQWATYAGLAAAAWAGAEDDPAAAMLDHLVSEPAHDALLAVRAFVESAPSLDACAHVGGRWLAELLRYGRLDPDATTAVGEWALTDDRWATALAAARRSDDEDADALAAAATARVHLLEGVVAGLRRPGELIELARTTDVTTAARQLREQWGLDEQQAVAVLDLQVRRFTTDSVARIEAELAELRRP